MVLRTFKTVMLVLLAVFTLSSVSEAAPKKVVRHRTHHTRRVPSATAKANKKTVRVTRHAAKTTRRASARAATTARRTAGTTATTAKPVVTRKTTTKPK
jgi:hypothetical protein